MVEGRMRTRLRGHMSGSYQLPPGCFPSAKMGMEDAGPGTQGLDVRPLLARPLKPLGASAHLSFYYWVFILRYPCLVGTVQIDKIQSSKFSSTAKPFEIRLAPSHSS